MTTAADVLDRMAATYRERNKVYSDNYLRIGNAMHAMFPQGLLIDTPAAWVRLYFFLLKQAKASRYATNFTRGGHVDSVHDSAVYAAMLEAFDADHSREVAARNRTKARAKAARKKGNVRKPKRRRAR